MCASSVHPKIAAPFVQWAAVIMWVSSMTVHPQRTKFDPLLVKAACQGNFFLEKWTFSRKKFEQAKVAFFPEMANLLKIPENGSKVVFWPNSLCKNTSGPPKAQKWPKTAKEKRIFLNFSARLRPPRPPKSAGKGRTVIFFKNYTFLKKQLGQLEPKMLPASLLYIRLKRRNDCTGKTNGVIH